MFIKRFVSSLLALVLLSSLVLPAVRVNAAATNLIANPSVETASGSGPANWTPNSWGTNTTALSYASTGHTGTKSLYVSTTASTNGDAKWIPDAVAVTPSQSYTYSEFYESNAATELDAQYTDASGNISYAYLGSVPASTSWAPETITFTTPATAAKVSVLHILASVGTLQTDDFSLAQTAVVVPPVNTDGNLISNPSFETANGSGPANWQQGGWGTNTSAFSYVTNDGHTGTHSAKIQTTSYTNGDAKWVFNPVAVTASKQYTFSDYYKSTIATAVVAQFDNGAGVYTYQTLSAPAASAAWQQTSVNFTTPATAKNVTIFHLISGVGTLQIDDASIVVPAVVAVPTVSITGPQASATISGTATITASATAPAPATAAKVQFLLDGANLGAAVTTAPFQQIWNTTTVLNGTHTLSAVVTTSDGKTATAATEQVTVNNVAANGNLVANPSMESADPANTKAPLGWNSSTWGTNVTKFTYPTSGHTGTHSVKTQITSYVSGSSYWYFNDVPVIAGQTYDYTDYYESSITSELDATFTMSDGSVQYMYIGDPSPSPNSWTKFRTQFTAPAGAVSMTVAHNIYGVGYLTVDDYSITPFSYQGFNRPIISLTFDDGYASTYTYGLPILQKYGFKSTDYIISGYLDNTAGYMTSAMVKNLYASGQEIGSHSVSHPDLTTLSAANMDSELKNSQAALQKIIGVPVTDYAAPYGAYNQQVVTDAQKYYKSYRGVQEGYNAKNNFDANNIVVQNLDDSTTLAQVKAWIAEAQATDTWLVLVYHQVDPNAVAAGQYNTLPSDLDAQFAAIKASGVAVETVSQALAELKPQL